MNSFYSMFYDLTSLTYASFPGMSGDIVATKFLTGQADRNEKRPAVPPRPSKIRSVTIPKGVTGIGGTLLGTTAVFDKPDVLEEVIFLQPEKIRLGYRLFTDYDESDQVKKPLKRLVIMADDVAFQYFDTGGNGTNINTYDYAANASKAPSTAAGSALYEIPRDTEIYIKRDSETHKAILTNIGIMNTYAPVYATNKWTNPNFVFLTQPISSMTAQDVAVSADLLLPAVTADVSYDMAPSRGYPSFKDERDVLRGGMTDTIPADILRPYQISAFDALAALHAKRYVWAEGSGGTQLAVNDTGVITRAFGKDAANLAVYVNGKRYANDKIARVQVGERDRVHFAFEPASGTVKLPVFYDSTDQITELSDMTPGKEKQLRLRYTDVNDEYETAYNLANTEVYRVDFETGAAEKIGATDGDGLITLKFTANG